MTTSKWVPIRNWFEDGLAFLAKFVAPIMSVAATVMGLPPGITNVIKAIPALMAAAEIAMPEPGSGPSKKAQVLASAKAFMDLADSKLTGGAKANFDALKPLLESLIDNGVAAINETFPAIIADDAVSPLPPSVGSGINAPIDSP